VGAAASEWRGRGHNGLPPLLLQLSTLEENSYFRLNLMASNIPLHLLPALLNREEMREVFF
jgi:hypothetical protein